MIVLQCLMSAVLVLAVPALGDNDIADFEVLSFEFLPDNFVIDDRFMERGMSVCIDVTARVSKITSGGVRMLEGETVIKGALTLITKGYLPSFVQETAFKVTMVQAKTPTGIKDGATFEAMATIYIPPVLPCSVMRMICVELRPEKFKDSNQQNNVICNDVRDRLRCSKQVPALPTCTVPAYPEFVAEPKDTYSMINDTVVFECAINRKAKTVTWYHEDKVVKHGDPTFLNTWLYPGGILMLYPVSKHHFGLYTCQVDDWNGNTIKTEAMLMDKKQSCDELVQDTPLNRTVKAGLPVLLSCMSDEADSITWRKDGKLITYDAGRQKMTHGQLLIRKVTTDDAGQYECLVTKGSLSCSMKSNLRVYDKIDELCGLPVLNQPIPLPDATATRTEFIVAGTGAPEGSSPWQAMLWFKGTLPRNSNGVALSRDFCGGVLLNDQWVATAAHCIQSIQRNYNHQVAPTDIIVRLGKRSRSAVEVYEKNVSVSAFEMKNFRVQTYDNDIALLKLAEHVEFNDHIRPICLGSASMYQPMRQALITGWGRVSSHGPRPTVLQQVQIPIRNATECRQSTSHPITPNMFCAGAGRRGGADSCHGDSGGPLSIRKGKRWYLLGLVSWGEGCSSPGKYGFYTKVGNYQNWILQHLRRTN